MKQHILSFLKKNWFKVGIAVFLLFVAFQDELSFNIDLNNPRKSRMTTPPEEQEITKQEILSDFIPDATAKPKSQRFKLQPFIPSWRKSKKETDTSPPKKKEVAALAKLAVLSPEEMDAFIRRFAHVAIGEQKKYGIPASVIIGNGLLLSTANKSVLSNDHQNFFRIPCTSDWEGDRTFIQGQCYRSYETAWLSFRDHSNYLKQMTINQGAELKATDYKAWAKFLDNQDFGFEKDYRRQLKQLIEDLELFYLDQSE